MLARIWISDYISKTRNVYCMEKSSLILKICVSLATFDLFPLVYRWHGHLSYTYPQQYHLVLPSSVPVIFTYFLLAYQRYYYTHIVSRYIDVQFIVWYNHPVRKVHNKIYKRYFCMFKIKDQIWYVSLVYLLYELVCN